MLTGKYAFKFSGFSRNNAKTPHHIVGLGVMEIFADKTIKGSQRTSMWTLTGEESHALTARFTLTGDHGLNEDQTGHANLVFTSVDPPQVLVASFDFVAVDGGQRLWLISTGAENSSLGDDPADEIVSGEAVRLSCPAD
jgi:hypothetical protein